MPLVINIANVIPQFKSKYDCKDLPLTDLVFNPDVMWKDYMKIVKDEENYDPHFGNYGGFQMHENF